MSARVPMTTEIESTLRYCLVKRRMRLADVAFLMQRTEKLVSRWARECGIQVAGRKTSAVRALMIAGATDAQISERLAIPPYQVRRMIRNVGPTPEYLERREEAIANLREAVAIKRIIALEPVKLAMSGMSDEIIAAKTGRSKNSVRVCLHKARGRGLRIAYQVARRSGAGAWEVSV